MDKSFYDLTTLQKDQWIAHQLEQWRKQKVSASALKDTPPPFITISREFGCTGFTLGEGLAAKLNRDYVTKDKSWSVYDRRLLAMIEEDHGIHQNITSALTKKARSDTRDFLSNWIADIPGQLAVYKKIFTAIRGLAHLGHAIVIGRGAAVATRGLEGGLHIRIYAPDDWKISKIMKIYDITSEKKAKAMLKKETRERETFVRKFFMVGVDDSHHYDLMFSDAYFSRDDMIDIVIETLRRKKYIK